MPTLSKKQAAKKLAEVVGKANPNTLAEFYEELFPETPPSTPPNAKELVEHIRNGLEAEELVDLWNVAFPKDYNVWYNEETDEIHYNEELIEYVE